MAESGQRSPAATAKDAAPDLSGLRERVDAIDRGILEQLNERARLVQSIGRRQGAKPAARSTRPRASARSSSSSARAIRGPFRARGSRRSSARSSRPPAPSSGSLRVAYFGPGGDLHAPGGAPSSSAQLADLACRGHDRRRVRGGRAAADRSRRRARREHHRRRRHPDASTRSPSSRSRSAAKWSCASRSSCCRERPPRGRTPRGVASAAARTVPALARSPSARHRARRDGEHCRRGAARGARTAVVAAIGSALAAERSTGCARSRRAIEDRRDNTTRFVVIGRLAPPASGERPHQRAVFTIRKDEAGALHRLLAPFAEQGVNLTSIQLRPIKGKPWEYLFFLDVEGHRSDPRRSSARSRARRRVAHSHARAGLVPARRGAARGASRAGRLMALESRDQPAHPRARALPARQADRGARARARHRRARSSSPRTRTRSGPSPQAVEAMRRALAGVHRYPDGASFRLRARLAAQARRRRPEQLVFGCGADEILELLAKAFLGPGDECVFAWPSFAMYPIVVQGMGATPVRVPLDAELVHDLAGARARGDAAHQASSSSATRTTRPARVSAPTPSTRFVGVVAADARARRRRGLRRVRARARDFPRRARVAARGGPARSCCAPSRRSTASRALRIGYGVADRRARRLPRARAPSVQREPAGRGGRAGGARRRASTRERTRRDERRRHRAS